MGYFIITAIIALTAAKANAQVKDNLTNSKPGEQTIGKQKMAYTDDAAGQKL